MGLGGFKESSQVMYDVQCLFHSVQYLVKTLTDSSGFKQYIKKMLSRDERLSPTGYNL